MTTPTTRDAGDLAAELADIAAAQAGEAAAVTRLYLRYRPLIRSTAARAAKARQLDPATREDLESDLTVALLELLPKFDPAKGAGLAVILPRTFQGIVAELDSPITIPRSTVSRYWAALGAADGNANQAAKIAHEHSLSTDLFWTVHYALAGATEEEAEVAPWNAQPATPPTTDVHEAAQLALSVLTVTEREVIEFAYGFRTPGAYSDAYVAEMLGKSPSTIRNTRARALDKMRAALPFTTLADLPATFERTPA